MGNKKIISHLSSLIKAVIGLLLATLLLGGFSFYLYYFYNPEEKPIEIAKQETPTEDAVVDGIHVATGLKDDTYLNLVITNCTACHSAKLVTQNRATKEGWVEIIRWMQKTQKLWKLGENEEKIVNYLSKNYAPENKGRRQALSNIEWYELD